MTFFFLPPRIYTTPKIFFLTECDRRSTEAPFLYNSMSRLLLLYIAIRGLFFLLPTSFFPLCRRSPSVLKNMKARYSDRPFDITFLLHLLQFLSFSRITPFAHLP